MIAWERSGSSRARTIFTGLRGPPQMGMDSPEFEKVEKALTDTRLVSAIKQASPLDQTSSLEGFHSVLNHYAPKMIGFSYVRMFIRHVVATVHFNCNLQREPRRRPDGTIQETVVYPKFKNGEATVRDVKVAPNFDYVDDIFETVCQAIASKSLTAASEELKQMTPAVMNTMLDKQPREEAIAKRHARQQMTVQDVPPTTPVAVVLQQEADAAAAAAARGSVRAKPTCRFCKQPMKCHSKVDCPRNMPSTQD